MHAFGGTLAGLLVLAVITEIYGENLSRKRAFFWILFGGFALGVIWEIFEYVTGMTFVSAHNFVSDTATDLVMDAVGCLIAYSLSLKKNV